MAHKSKIRGFAGPKSKPVIEVNLVKRDNDGNPTGQRIRSQYWGGEQLGRDFNDAGEYRAK